MGELHVKPTKAQLKAEAEKKLREAEELERQGKGAPQPTPSPSAGVSPSPSEGAPSSSPSPSEAPSFSVSASPSESLPSGSLSASPSPSAAPDDEAERQRKRAAASAREAQILHARTKKYDEAVIEAEAVQVPTDEQMIEEYGKDDWEDMSPGQQRLAKETWVSNKRFEIMSKASKEGKDIQQWMDKVNTFIEDPKTLNKYPVLEGKQEEFKEFAAKPTRRGLDFDDLVLAFKGDLKDNPQQKKKGQMFEKGSPGRKEAPKPNDGKLSIEAAAKLKKTDYKKWKEYLKAGKIREV